MHRGGTRHAVGRAFNQAVKSQSHIQTVTKPGICGWGCRFAACDGRIGRCGGRSKARFGWCITLRQSQFEGNGLAMQTLQHLDDFLCVLGTNPVHLEAVGDKQSQPPHVLTELRVQGLDPGVELLLGQITRQLIEAGQPQRGTRVVGKIGKRTL